MSTNYMKESEALKTFLAVHPPAGGVTIFSGFTHALTEARRTTGRDIHTGAKVDAALHGSWIGAIGYFALLDQISDCFKPRQATLSNTRDLRRALEHFTSLNPPDRDALYALRCAFAHDYSLYNINSRHASLTHNFQVVRAGSGPVVSPAKISWNGDFRTRSSDNQTTVNLEAFGDLVEDVVRAIRSLHAAGNLEIVLADGSDELVSRYMFSSR